MLANGGYINPFSKFSRLISAAKASAVQMKEFGDRNVRFYED